MNDIAKVHIRTSFSSIMIKVNYNDEVIFCSISQIPKLRVNGEFVYRNYELLQKCKNDAQCKDLLLLIDNLNYVLKCNDISRIKLNVSGPNYVYFLKILNSLEFEIVSIFDATFIPQNIGRRVRKKQY